MFFQILSKSIQEMGVRPRIADTLVSESHFVAIVTLSLLMRYMLRPTSTGVSAVPHRSHMDMSGLDLRSVHMIFVVDHCQWNNFSRSTLALPCQYHSTNAPYSPSPTRCYQTDKRKKNGHLPDISGFQEMGSIAYKGAVTVLLRQLTIVFAVRCEVRLNR